MQEPTDLIVVFDLLEDGFQFWFFPAIGLVVFAAGLVTAVSAMKKGMGLLKASVLPSFALLWTALAFVSTYGKYAALKEAYEDGHYETVEGFVEFFKPYPSGTDKKGETGYEVFRVGEHRFAFSARGMKSEYNTPRSKGSPIGPGVYVLIHHVGGRIVHLEAERQAIGYEYGKKLGLKNF